MFGKDKNGKSARGSVGKMNFDANVAVFYQLETDFTRIYLGCEIKSKQRTTVLALFSRNIIACVAIILTGLRKQMEVTSNKAVVGKVRLQEFGRDLNNIMIKRHEIDAVVLEMERRFGDDPVVSVVVHHTDHRSRQLPQKQVFLGDASISSRYGKDLDFHASHRVFCSAVLQGSDVSKLYSRVGFYFAYKQGHFFQRHFVLCLVCVFMQAKKILGLNQTQAYFDSVQQVTILKSQINM